MAAASSVSLLRDLRTWLDRIRECRHPRVLASAVGSVLARRRWLRFATGKPDAVTGGYLREIEDDVAFLTEIRGRLRRWTDYEPRAVDFMMPGGAGSVFFNEVTLYALVRAVRPAVVVETGGTPGKSTAFILRAMERNAAGWLYTVDLPPPATDRPQLVHWGDYHAVRPAGVGSNWIVPDALRARHTLRLGRSRDVLPPLLAGLDRVDVFVHDSEHTYVNMIWEFETMWPKLAPDGLLVSDDILANRAFVDFCARAALRAMTVVNLGVARRG